MSFVLSAVSSSFDNDMVGMEGPLDIDGAALLLEALECFGTTSGVFLGEPVLPTFVTFFPGSPSMTLTLWSSFFRFSAADTSLMRFTTLSGISEEVRSMRILPARAAESLRGAVGRACVVVRIYNSDESPGLVWMFKGKKAARMWMPCDEQQNISDLSTSHRCLMIKKWN